jgi:transcriptional regulator with XRE-family HTH domain
MSDMNNEYFTTDYNIEEEIKKLCDSDPEQAKVFRRKEKEYGIIKAIKTARKAKDMSQSELAELAGTKQQAIGRLEKSIGAAERSSPTLRTLINILDVLDLELKVIPKEAANQKEAEAQQAANLEHKILKGITATPLISLFSDNQYMQEAACTRATDGNIFRERNFEEETGCFTVNIKGIPVTIAVSINPDRDKELKYLQEGAKK